MTVIPFYGGDPRVAYLVRGIQELDASCADIDARIAAIETAA